MEIQSIVTSGLPELSAASRPAERIAGALFTLLGSLLMMLGTTWDIQWHVRVGRDSFWIPPHVVVYAGLGLIIATAAFLILRETITPAADPLTVFGLRAGAGTWISTAGASTMLLAAVFDDWWHRTFGLDVTLWSPPHLLLIAGAAIILWGALTSLSLELRSGRLTARASRWASMGLIVGCGQFMGPFALALQPATRLTVLSQGAEGPFLYPMLAALAIPGVLAASRTATGRRWGALTTALILIGLAILANRFSAAGFRLVLGGLPGGTGQGGGTTLLRWLPLLPAAALDLIAGTPGRGRWRLILGAAAWAVIVTAYMSLLWLRFIGSAPLPQAIAALPVVMVGAVGSAVIGNRVGASIAAKE